jgi:hypothetical protein
LIEYTTGRGLGIACNTLRMLVCVYIAKKSSFPELAYQFSQTLYKLSLGKGNLKLYKSRAISSSNGEIITKMQK